MTAIGLQANRNPLGLTCPQPPKYGRVLRSGYATPGHGGSRLAVDGDHHVGPGVAVLLSRGRPAAVLWGVRPVVVDPIERHSRRVISHVRVEILEPGEPPVTHDDTPSAIPVVCCVAVVRASVFSSAPTSVCRRRSHAVTTVGPADLSRLRHPGLMVEATTGARIASREIGPEYVFCSSACTRTQPLQTTIVLFSGDGRKPPERLACDIDERRHDYCNSGIAKGSQC